MTCQEEKQWSRFSVASADIMAVPAFMPLRRGSAAGYSKLPDDGLEALWIFPDYAEFALKSREMKTRSV